MNRHTKLKFDGYLSQEWIPINNGISQGDPLSMILYIIYNADLLVVPKGRECTEKTQAFVDDTMFLAISRDFSETHAILKDMMEREGGGYDWAKAHNSKFEMSKFALMDFSPQAKCKRPTMNLRGTTLTPMPQHKFLGVIIDHTLRWNAQVSHAIAKGTAYAIQLKRLSTTSNSIPLALMCRLYLAVAIPKMLYTVDVWYRPIYTGKDDKTQPGSIGIARKLESTQLGICMGIPQGTAGHTHTRTRGKPIPMSGVWVSAVGYEKWTRGTTHGGSYPRVSCI